MALTDNLGDFEWANTIQLRKMSDAQRALVRWAFARGFQQGMNYSLETLHKAEQEAFRVQLSYRDKLMNLPKE